MTESQNELVVIGPQEAFIEDIETNLSLIRHKIKHPDLKPFIIRLVNIQKLMCMWSTLKDFTKKKFLKR